MHLKSLTLRGFKSFASATTLDFEPGITCVVGPNGSGKSNVVDALAWVMGEQGARSLRGVTMEDVVFAGSGARPALGRAEVALTIDNSDRALPIEYTEVTITRTMFRTGGSEYAINQQPCRLLDVQELLSDSGIGRELHVVVGQGQLDAVLRATPEGRRGFLEEAAGVRKHRSRKEKALRKLDATDGNLLRLQDVLGEIRRQLKPLGRQAEVARRAAHVQAEARDAKARLLADDLVAARRTVAAQRASETAVRQRRAALEQSLAATRASQSTLEGRLADLAAAAADAGETWHALGQIRERLGGTAVLAAERVRSAGSEQLLLPGGPDPDTLEAEAASVRAREDEIGADCAAAKLALQQVVGQREAAELALVTAEQRREEQAQREGDAGIARARLRDSTEEIERLSAARAAASHRAEQAQHDYTALEVQVAGLDAGESGLDAEHEAAVAALRDIEDRLSKHREEASAGDRERTRLTARRDALRLGLDRRDAVDLLMAAAEPPPGVIGPTAQLVRVRPGFEVAVGAALGPAADSLAVRDLAAAVTVLDQLRTADHGSATLLIAAGVAEPLPRPDVPLGGRRAVDLVEVFAPVAAPVHRLLADVVVVEDLAAAEALVGQRPELVAVTRAGEVVGRALAAGGSARAATRIELASAYDQASEALERAVSAGERLRFDGERLAAERTEAQGRADVALARLHESDATMAAVAERLGQLAALVRSARAEVERLDEALDSATAAQVGHRATLAELERQLSSAELEPAPKLEAASDHRAALAARAEECRRLETEARLAVRTLEERTRALAGRADSLRASADGERRARAAFLARRERSQRVGEVAGAVLAATQRTLERLERSLTLASQRRTALSSEHGSVAAEHDRVRRELSAFVADLERLQDEEHREQVSEAEHRMRLQQLEQRSAEELGLEADDLVAAYGPHLPVAFVRAEQQERLRAAERDLALLGSVNPLALEEFDALEERHAFLSGQLSDLQRTRSDLLGIVSDVDERIAVVLGAAWQDTEREFRAVFARLFPGGEGRLVLTEPADLVASGIEVEARPAGKNVKRLSLLSGGERALVALAFLLALFRARPSPFYILDEVEAALDDTNLSRLLNIYDELRATSQLVVITHQKRTMAIADALYGVSMAADGVSTVISSRLREPAQVPPGS